MFTDQTLLITGGTGTFGNAVLERVLRTDVREIRVFSRDEAKQDEMRKRYRDHRVTFCIGDVRDLPSVQSAMCGVDFVFHAAALKQVPSCEFFPMEAVKTNILGTDNVLTAAIACRVKKVVCLSTDKAVHPASAMGISKAMMERVFVAKSRTAGDTLICGTRHGNILCSRGSVVPLFVEQIQNGQPLTVTDAAMVRFIATPDEAVDLVLHAFANAAQGDIMVQKAPACTIGTLAQAVKDVFAANNPIHCIGNRHGEKTCEALLAEEEHARAIDMGQFYRIPADNRDLRYDEIKTGTPNGNTREDSHSGTITLLSAAQVTEKLLTTAYMQEALSKLPK